jgi:putative transposase
MPNQPEAPSTCESWALFRFRIVGPLLALVAGRGRLSAELDRLAATPWRHPRSGQPVRVGRSTIERWYYRALRNPNDPMAALSRRARSDRDRVRSLSPALAEVLVRQYKAHPNWSCRLHTDNLAVLVAENPRLGPMPSYNTLRRFMAGRGMPRRRLPRASDGARQAQLRLETREVRSYESEYPNALWHLDYHHGSRRVLCPDGSWARPVLLGVLDDHSRVCCHLQWYLAETAQNLVHALMQALVKRGLPRALMSDNGSPMMAAETTQGLERLAIVHETTLPYSPYQNGKQESFWGQVEGRLLPMLEGVGDLTLARLNQATQAWVEMEYNRREHSELQASPNECFARGRDVGRAAPTMDRLVEAFTARMTRTQRRCDQTVSVQGKRFEIPSRYGHLTTVHLRGASWDLSHLYLCDPATGRTLTRIYPQDKIKNGEGRRRTRSTAQSPAAAAPASPASAPADDVAPLLRSLIAEYAATGLPPAYLPSSDEKEL